MTEDETAKRWHGMAAPDEVRAERMPQTLQRISEINARFNAKVTPRPRYPDGAVVMDEHVTAEHVAELAAEVERLRAEVERLRAALIKIAETYDSDIEWPGGDEEDAASYAGTARFALSGGDIRKLGVGRDD